MEGGGEIGIERDGPCAFSLPLSSLMRDRGEGYTLCTSVFVTQGWKD